MFPCRPGCPGRHDHRSVRPRETGPPPRGPRAAPVRRRPWAGNRTSTVVTWPICSPENRVPRSGAPGRQERVGHPPAMIRRSRHGDEVPMTPLVVRPGSASTNPVRTVTAGPGWWSAAAAYRGPSASNQLPRPHAASAGAWVVDLACFRFHGTEARPPTYMSASGGQAGREFRAPSSSLLVLGRLEPTFCQRPYLPRRPPSLPR